MFSPLLVDFCFVSTNFFFFFLRCFITGSLLVQVFPPFLSPFSSFSLISFIPFPFFFFFFPFLYSFSFPFFSPFILMNILHINHQPSLTSLLFFLLKRWILCPSLRAKNKPSLGQGDTQLSMTTKYLVSFFFFFF